MVNLCIALEAIIIICFIIKNNIYKGKIILDHILCFSVGYVYYGLLPLFLFQNKISFADTIYNRMEDIFQQISEKQKIFYLLIMLFWLIAFYAGSTRKSIVFRNTRKIFRKEKDKITFIYSQKLFFILMIILGVFMLYLNRNSLLTGYISKHSSEYKGSLSAYVTMLFSMVLLYFLSIRKKNFKKASISKWGMAYIFFALMLLSMGGRLYVISNIIALLIVFSMVYTDGISIGKLIRITVIVLFIVGMIGVLRANMHAGITFRQIAFNLLQEPINTNYSLFTYLAYCDIGNWGSFPVVFVSSLINFIPRIFLPTKENYIKTVYNLQPNVKSPLGATQFFVSYNVDFGIIPTVLFLFVLGNFLAYLRKKNENNNIISNTVYCMISSNLMFTFFRDGVMTSLVKNIMEFSFLVPIIIVYINAFLAKKTIRYNQHINNH
ncbi:MAG: oligosaccharide repeat unit polymerase [Lachnospiraceae bacterium]|jgi:oligosaccharide repeat unit polymerase|uniref:O-antigen polymerase n=1 Tax=uncultured Acetatifactor sp. TaxID=1671927 RepID=UPI00260883A4|nr:O-antigen polymerase [uncultured Acetatifactor sp.]MCI8791074.1 oligosaccharide repeat unit polymerase [Lachnospiraceae bacterium]